MCRSPSGRRQAEKRARQAQEEGAVHRAGDDRGAHDRHELLGQVVVQQPRALQRLSRTACRAAASYVRNGFVVDLQIAKGEVTAMVSGSELYKVKITIAPVAATRWKAICRDCAGTIDSLVELLQGRLAKGVMDRVCREGDGLFPAPSEIKLSCSCPDWADMCKHVAAALYGVGARLDEKPQLLFVLRGVDENELLAGAGQDLALIEVGAEAGEGARRRRCRGPVRAGDGRKCQFQGSRARCFKAISAGQDDERGQDFRSRRRHRRRRMTSRCAKCEARSDRGGKLKSLPEERAYEDGLSFPYDDNWAGRRPPTSAG